MKISQIEQILEKVKWFYLILASKYDMKADKVTQTEPDIIEMLDLLKK